MAAVPADFISLSTLCPQIIVRASYASAENFTGEPVRGYLAPKAYLARVPALALCEVQKRALRRGLTLKIFDGYRPTKAVSFFQEWAKKTENNPQVKALYYPKYTRAELFEQGYIAARSSHSRGSAVDLTLSEVATGKDLDMGTGFDYFDDLSHTASPKITVEQSKNRQLLKRLMEEQGFKNYDREWWHYSFKPEPYPDQYYDFNVE